MLRSVCILIWFSTRFLTRRLLFFIAGINGRVDVNGGVRDGGCIVYVLGWRGDFFSSQQSAPSLASFGKRFTCSEPSYDNFP